MYEVTALGREALEEPWQFRFDGEVYSLPNDFDVRAAACLAGGDLNNGLRILLGTEQWERLCASPKVFGTAQLIDMINAYTNAIGADLGELRAPSNSSSNTAPPSKPTSNGTTTSPWPTSSLSPSG